MGFTSPYRCLRLSFRKVTGPPIHRIKSAYRRFCAELNHNTFFYCRQILEKGFEPSNQYPQYCVFSIRLLEQYARQGSNLHSVPQKDTAYPLGYGRILLFTRQLIKIIKIHSIKIKISFTLICCICLRFATSHLFILACNSQYEHELYIQQVFQVSTHFHFWSLSVVSLLTIGAPTYKPLRSWCVTTQSGYPTLRRVQSELFKVIYRRIDQQGQRDSNSHYLRNYILGVACLPIPPYPLISSYIYYIIIFLKNQVAG